MKQAKSVEHARATHKLSYRDAVTHVTKSSQIRSHVQSEISKDSQSTPIYHRPNNLVQNTVTSSNINRSSKYDCPVQLQSKDQFTQTNINNFEQTNVHSPGAQVAVLIWKILSIKQNFPPQKQIEAMTKFIKSNYNVDINPTNLTTPLVPSTNVSSPVIDTNISMQQSIEDQTQMQSDHPKILATPDDEGSQCDTDCSEEAGTSKELSRPLRNKGKKAVKKNKQVSSLGIKTTTIKKNR